MSLSIVKFGVKVFRYFAVNNNHNMSGERLHEEMLYLNNLPEPIMDANRSYCQYRCQFFHRSRFFIFLLNTLSFFLFLPTVILLLTRKIHNNSSGYRDTAVFLMAEKYNDLLPRKIMHTFRHIKYDGFNTRMILKREDVSYILHNMKYKPFAIFFWYKILLKLALYRGIVSQYSPVAIIAASEYSFSSSVLTHYCEFHNIEHINIMHGERLLQIGAGFFRFSRCYVWDTHYVNIFNALRADKDQFIVERPPLFDLKTRKEEVEQMTDLKYYLSAHTHDELLTIAANMVRLASCGYKVKVRPHPIYCIASVAEKFFDSEMLEDDKSITIDKSLALTRYVIGVNSTVLLQGYFQGKGLVFDDIVYHDRINLLKEYGYILLCKEVPRKYLSGFLSIS